ncbi:uncharacterized protein LOC110825301 [Carica papaya]|uniref:uncharacterized protein LOC110825301 n=1 Tax=Carica papaya TaxID=3649 RepID=UPI000B8D11AD|nr:uncharacterized protein LOC110825301 [Carica papaya]
MATSLACSLPPAIRASSGSLSKKPDLNHKKPVSSTWWAPLFGWSADPDYINTALTNEPPEKKIQMSDPENEMGRHRPRFPLGCFTEEKAKQLRKTTMEGSSFHDMMYHSAIASRLASEASSWHGE